jgi:hypothetical protein
MRSALIFAALPVLWASLAAAQGNAPAAAAPATPKEAAQESYARGNKLFNLAEQKHDRTLYEAAYLQFSQAYAIFPSEKIAWNLAVTECKTDRYVDALRHLRIYDKEEHVAEQPRHPDHVVFVALFEQAAKATGHLLIDASPGAKLRLDQNDAGTSPLADPIDVVPGPHRIEAAFISGKTMAANVSPAAGETARVSLTEPASDAASPTATADPMPSQATAVPPDRTPHSTGFFTARNTVALGLGVVAVAAFAGGAGFEVASGSDQDRANQLGAQLPAGENVCGAGTTVPQCSSFKDAKDSAAREQTAATALFITGGVAAAAAVGVLLLWPGDAARSGAGSLAPMLSVSTAGLGWRGVF